MFVIQVADLDGHDTFSQLLRNGKSSDVGPVPAMLMLITVRVPLD